MIFDLRNLTRDFLEVIVNYKFYKSIITSDGFLKNSIRDLYL